jgi:hypothetical protein
MRFKTQRKFITLENLIESLNFQARICIKKKNLNEINFFKFTFSYYFHT